MSVKAEGSVVVEAPVDAVYTQWTRFEEFPRFMGGVTSVQVLTDARLAWIVELDGKYEQWETQVLELVPDEKVSWAGTDEVTRSGTATFKETEEGHTHVHLTLEYGGEDQRGVIGSEMNVVMNPAEKDLQRFKELLETDEDEIELWSGTFEDGTGEPTG